MNSYTYPVKLEHRRAIINAGKNLFREGWQSWTVEIGIVVTPRWALHGRNGSKVTGRKSK
jgi:hypothetical protein